ncbi:MAG: hypothetical protein E7316_01665 [Clostridiales bacterium]|nr:hypothetical protein [Clostridiales bacterium]
MKKILTIILALALACVIPLTALGATVVSTAELPADLQFSNLLNSGKIVAYGRGEDNYLQYWLTNISGEELTPHYYDIDTDSTPGLSTFVDGLTHNDAGVMNSSTGEIIVPAEYGDIDIVSDKWFVGVHLVLSDDPEAPYRNLFSDDRFDILDFDVYYGSQKVATLAKEEFGYFTAYGNYLMLRNENNYIWLDAAGEKLTYERSGSYGSEYSEDYKTKTVTHNGSGQVAFVPGCTLTSADVDRAFWMAEAGIVDLQGNVILAQDAFPHEDLRLYDSFGDYLGISVYDDELSDTLYGVMDKTGKILVPCELTDVPYLSPENPWFENGILYALSTDNHLNFYDTTGALINAIDLTPYGEDPDYETNGEITLIEYGEDQIALISTAKGVIDVSAYEELEFYDCGLVAVKQNDLWGVMDQNGDVIIPCIHKGYPSITKDGTAAEGYYYNEDSDRVSLIYTIEP